MIFGMIYYLMPRIYKTSLFSEKLANAHFWIATTGILFWALPMYVSGWTQSLMWKEFNPDGTLVYGNFLETVTQLIPLYFTRAIGGVLYITGMIIMVVNVIRTVQSGKLVAQEEASALPLSSTEYVKKKGEHWHRVIERRPVQLMIFSIVAILIGGIIEIVPTIMVKSNVPTISAVKPYTALELEGRDLYIREGCNACHSQMIRPFRSEVARYGEYSKAGEFVYDHPFLWGSKRTGPDLHREGGKYPHSWHYNHMLAPTSMSPGSIMPAYEWLYTSDLDTEYTTKKLEAMVSLGVPYSADYVANAQMHLTAQAEEIAAELESQLDDVEVSPKEEIIALIAYLQRLGIDIKGTPSKHTEATVAGNLSAEK
jgi:cytochrome c oxidase cbb3-type subunit I/II